MVDYHSTQFNFENNLFGSFQLGQPTKHSTLGIKTFGQHSTKQVISHQFV